MQSLRTPFFALVASCLLAASTLRAGEPTCAAESFPRAQDTLWLINSRHLCASELQAKGGATEKAAAQLEFSRLDNDEWRAANLHDYIAAEDEAARTIIWIHGFWTDSCKAICVGQQVFRTLVDAETDPAPLRLVIWSWPSDRIRGMRLRDNALVAGCRSDTEGLLLAELLNQSKSEDPVAVLAYSLGARAMFAALHMLDGGDVDGEQIDATPLARKIPIRGVAMATAVHNYWLDADQRYARALVRAEHLVLLNNQCDRALRWYPAAFGSSRRCGPQALGVTGLVAADLAADVRHKFEQLDVCCYVGRQHEVALYLAYADLVEKMRQGAFGDR
jgi:hypothetical protein